MNPYIVVNVFCLVFRMKHLLLIDIKLPFYFSLLTAPIDQSLNSLLSCMDKNPILKIGSTAVNRTVIWVYNPSCISTDRWLFSLIYSAPLFFSTFFRLSATPCLWVMSQQPTCDPTIYWLLIPSLAVR